MLPMIIIVLTIFICTFLITRTKNYIYIIKDIDDFRDREGILYFVIKNENWELVDILEELPNNKLKILLRRES